MSTLDKVINALPSKPTPRKQGNVMRSASPLRPDSDGHSFVLFMVDDEYGSYYDHVSKESGSLYQLADLLGIERPHGKGGQDDSHDFGKVAIKDLAHYAELKGVPVETFKNAGWEDGEHHGRKAIIYPTQSGKRVRFLDGNKPKYMPIEAGMDACWYGLERAITLAKNDSHQTVYIVNGEASVIVAQHHNIPACAVTGGERKFPDKLADELKAKWTGNIAHVPDSDKAGRDATSARIEQVGGVVVDLKLFNKGDIADFCLLFDTGAYKALRERTPSAKSITPIQLNEFVSIGQASEIWGRIFDGDDSVLDSAVAPVPVTWEMLKPMLGDYVAGGKIIALASSSGAGKTMMLETWAYENGIEGVPTLFVSPEWQPTEFALRMMYKAWVMQSNPPSYVEMLAFLRNAKYGYWSEDRRKFMKHAMETISKLDIDFHNIRVAKTTNIRSIIEQVQWRIIERERKGLKPYEMIFFDYVSVFDIDGASVGNIEEEKVNLFKQLCMNHNVVGVTTSQVNKDAVRRIYTDGGYFNGMDMYGIREDKFNYVITATRLPLLEGQWFDYSQVGDEPTSRRKILRDESGVSVPTSNILYFMAKNSVMPAMTKSYGWLDKTRLRINKGTHHNWMLDAQNNLMINPSASVASFQDL